MTTLANTTPRAKVAQTPAAIASPAIRDDRRCGRSAPANASRPTNEFAFVARGVGLFRHPPLWHPLPNIC